MSVQFGRWSFEGQPPSPEYIEKVNATLATYGPDSDESYSDGGITMLYRAFHVTKESHREKQPHISLSRAVITLDGRLDNRSEIISEVGDPLTTSCTDVDIVAAAYDKWGKSCFGKLIGDWALSIWNPRDRSVVLAKDPIGTKHLYYSLNTDRVTWSTILDPLVLFAERPFAICEEYIASWFAICFPAAHLTPYADIYAVPASSSVLLQPGKYGVNRIITKYWDFDPGKCIRYRTDAQYEEHFRTTFAKAVQRRLRSDRPVVAELSGGMDSSSIVCMADIVIARGGTETGGLDTISWYDDSYDNIEPDTNELHWIREIERKRARAGHHINLRELRSQQLSPLTSSKSEFERDRFESTPNTSNCAGELIKRYAAYMKSQGHRVALSGVGGSEFFGDGVPTPTPELQNLLVRARFFSLIRQSNSWAMKIRRKRLSLLWEALSGFFLAAPLVGFEYTHVGSHFLPGFARRNRVALCGYPSRLKLLGPLPSFQDNVHTLEYVRRVQENYALYPELLYDKRYPYLDRDLLEFVCAIPREQIVGVGKRRFLMKRALVDIVPDEVLSRKRKAFIPQEPRRDRSTEWSCLIKTRQHMVSSSVGIIDADQFSEMLQKAQCDENVPIQSLMKTVKLEFWLRHLTVQGVPMCRKSSPRQNDYTSAEGQRAPRAFSD